MAVANRVPATFVDMLEDKVTAHGGSFVHIQTTKAKASQYTHTDKAYRKVKLSQRAKTLQCDGRNIVVQTEISHDNL